MSAFKNYFYFINILLIIFTLRLIIKESYEAQFYVGVFPTSSTTNEMFYTNETSSTSLDLISEHQLEKFYYIG